MVELMLHGFAYCIMSQEFDVLSQFGNQGLKAFLFFPLTLWLGQKEFRHCCLQGPGRLHFNRWRYQL